MSNPIQELLEDVKQRGLIFLGRISSAKLAETGFVKPPMYSEYADIYLLFKNGGYVIQYVFDYDYDNAIYQKEEDLGKELFLEVVSKYIQLGNEEFADNE